MRPKSMAVFIAALSVVGVSSCATTGYDAVTVIYDARYDQPLSVSPATPRVTRYQTTARSSSPQTVHETPVDDRWASSQVLKARDVASQDDLSPCYAMAEEEKSKVGFWGNIGKGIIVGGALGLSIGILASGLAPGFPPEMIIGALAGAGVGGGASGWISANEAEAVYSTSLEQCLMSQDGRIPNDARSW